MPAKLKELQDVFNTRNTTRFEAAKVSTDPALCAKYVSGHRGFLGPTND
jgi:hypothetical protein